ncbi:MAG TPA: S24 family peptidase [Rubrivivax sp.]|nr:S24 family peptidase [Rubrivivax sp.]HPP82417.1 S24 family peptidase [Rubrivivax sp.]
MSQEPRWDDGCSGAESFALRVLGDDMAPEFRHGEIIVVEPGGALTDGSFVVARHAGEWTLRQLRRVAGGWVLHALNPASGEPADVALADLGAVRGVVIQKAVPGRRRLSRFYV